LLHLAFVFLVCFSFFISHVARYTPSSKQKTASKILDNLMQLIFFTSLRSFVTEQYE